MAINVRPVEQSMEKWERNSQNAGDDYLTGAENPRRSWADTASASEGNYKTQVINAANAGRFGKGIKKAGNAKWIGAIRRKGKANYQTGTMGAGSDWAAGAKPYLATVGALTLKPRGAKNSAQNYERSQAVGTAQSMLKQELLNR